jgi:hypothetical protein
VARCPGSKKIVGAKLGCNLEQPVLSVTSVEQLDWDRVTVLQPSQRPADGRCGIDSAFYLMSGEASAAPYLGAASQWTVRCREHDQNGGDCALRGELLCL